MPESPQLRYLSLFVPDLAEAAPRYEAVLGVPPSRHPGDAPPRHPCAAAGPVVFQLGQVALALYQCDQRTTHPGDVGIGLVAPDPAGQVAERARSQQGMVLLGPTPLEADPRQLEVFMLPDRHFFEVVTGS